MMYAELKDRHRPRKTLQQAIMQLNRRLKLQLINARKKFAMEVIEHNEPCDIAFAAQFRQLHHARRTITAQLQTGRTLETLRLQYRICCIREENEPRERQWHEAKDEYFMQHGIVYKTLKEYAAHWKSAEPELDYAEHQDRLAITRRIKPFSQQRQAIIRQWKSEHPPRPHYVPQHVQRREQDTRRGRLE
jgi:hypothetical protein